MSYKKRGILLMKSQCAALSPSASYQKAPAESWDTRHVHNTLTKLVFEESPLKDTLSSRTTNTKVYAIGESDGNCFLAARIYAKKYPNRSHPDVRSLQNVNERFERTGSVSYEKKSRTPTVLNEENHVCQRINFIRTMFSYTTNYLLENDFERRIHFCQWVHNVVVENEDFFKFMLFTDECTFHRNGFVNRHNFHYYDTQNSHIVQVNNHQHNWSINVWGGILHNYVIGPYILQGSVTGEVFQNFLRNDFPRLIQHVPDFIKNRMWLQLDEASAHFSVIVRHHLNEHFPNAWIGRQGPTAWPPRSADLTPMDYFLWGVVKSDVYRVPATTREDNGGENSTIISMNISSCP
ncbi:hypothetical protein NQ315_014794 [Exocentrus adspersus]|uniref:DUF4817 domain-containing protein n=1 Tax=Exocentrus adspersus TaxID=1586481 RepID=A0AAV8VLR5_9CUCU|nr:hypothetical protein NQ315_014794 [Exocentrus adspersus]